MLRNLELEFPSLPQPPLPQTRTGNLDLTAVFAATLGR